MSNDIAKGLEAPFYIVSFTSVLDKNAGSDYGTTADRMVELAQTMPGFLGMESVRDDKLGITLSYWKDRNAILNWKRNTEHLAAKAQGRTKWYDAFALKIAKVERSDYFTKS